MVMLPILPPGRDESFPAEPGSGRLYGGRNTCATCGQNLRRHDSLFRECAACQANPAPLVAEKAPKVTYGCGCE